MRHAVYNSNTQAMARVTIHSFRVAMPYLYTCMLIQSKVNRKKTHASSCCLRKRFSTMSRPIYSVFTCMSQKKSVPTPYIHMPISAFHIRPTSPSNIMMAPN